MIILLKIFLALSFITLYQQGGQGKLLFKKWLAPIFLICSIILTSYLNKSLNIYIAISSLFYLLAANSFSYGEKFTQNKTWKKVVSRGLCGGMYGVAGLLLGIFSGHLILGIIQLILAILGSILFGVLNPFPSSWGNWATRSEDICISALYIILLPFII